MDRILFYTYFLELYIFGLVNFLADATTSIDYFVEDIYNWDRSLLVATHPAFIFHCIDMSYKIKMYMILDIYVFLYQ